MKDAPPITGDDNDTLVPQKHGGALRKGGRIGHKGGPGRTPDQFRAMLKELLNDPLTVENVKRQLQSDDAKNPVGMWTTICDRVYGKPTDTVTLNATVAATIEREPLRIMLPLLDMPARLAGATNGNGDERVLGRSGIQRCNYSGRAIGADCNRAGICVSGGG